jgi:hypothetical protein
VNLVRDRVADWRRAGYPGVTATTLETLNYWRRDGRAFRPFFAQFEAVETIIFLNEARIVHRDTSPDAQLHTGGYRPSNTLRSADFRLHSAD